MSVKRKLCKYCCKRKALTSFYEHKKTRDGRMSKCKECHKAYQNARREDPEFREKDNARRTRHYYENRQKHLETCKTYVETNKGSAASRRAKKRRESKNGHKKKVAGLLCAAVKSGKILRPKRCSRCGARAKVHGHHEDYSKPLAVEWLCSPCHREHHRKRLPNGKLRSAGEKENQRGE